MTETPYLAAAAALPPVRPNLPEFSVSELSAALKRSIEQTFAVVRVRGEISGWKRHSSGHCYFALKDEDAVLDAVCWRNTAMRLSIKPEDGMEVVLSGRLTTYPGRSKYQIVVESIELAGVGALLKLLEERKARLAAEGLFAEERKKKLPFLPQVIGVVTSPTGAVIRDILHRLNDRFPRHVLLWPVAVQGEGAAAQVTAAIEGFNRLPPDGPVPRPDLLIVARGGGSLEDLMAFNEESVVRAAAASTIPLISAVGHETDTTLIDYASDRRAPTPTAAAEMAVPVRLELLADLDGMAVRLSTGVVRLFAERRMRLERDARGLPDPRNLLGAAQQKLDDRAERLTLALRQMVRLRAHQLEAVQGRLTPDALRLLRQRMAQRVEELAPRLHAAAARHLERQHRVLDGLAGRLASYWNTQQQALERGYVRVRDAAGQILTAAEQVAPGASLSLEFHDGKVAVTADGATPRSPRTSRSPAPKPDQGSLL
jgi:exodeoxyribonuclease VII large subunit